MTGTKRVDIARKRGEFSRDQVRRRLSPALAAQRRLNIRRAGAAGIGVRYGGPRDPRYEYLKHTPDSDRAHGGTRPMRLAPTMRGDRGF